MTTVALLLFAAVVLSTLIAARPRGDEVEVLEICPMGHRVTLRERWLRVGSYRFCQTCKQWYERTS